MKKKTLTTLVLSITALLVLGFAVYLVGYHKKGEVGGELNLSQNVRKTGLPIVKDKITIKVATIVKSYNKVPFANMENTKAFEERTNVHIDWQEIPEGIAQDRISIMLASGDIPDALMQLVDTANLIKNYDSGLFLPLNDLIDKWAPNIKKILQDPTVKSQLVLGDGNIYSTPAGEMAPWLQTRDHLFVNKVWLDELGLKLPQSTEEYRQALKAVKAKDKNKIPLSIVGADNFRTLLGAFGIACELDYIFVRNGKVGYAPATENFKKALKYFHQLYIGGLIDSESFAQNVNQLRAKAKNGVVFSFNQFSQSSTVGDVKLTEQYKSLLPLIGPDGHQEYSQRINVAQHGLVVSAKTKYPEVIIRWVDYLNSDFMPMMEARGGLESQATWVNLGNGKYMGNTDNIPEGLSNAEWLSNTGWFTSAPVFLSNDFVSSRRSLDNDPVGADALARTREYLKYQLKEVMPVVMVEPEINQELSLINNELTLLLRDYMSRTIIQGFNDSDWNTFQSNLKKAKYARYVELKQQIYDKSK